jgi:hypothetical protein
MQRKSLKINKQKLRLEIEGKSKFFSPVVRNGWWIKFSTYRDHFILLTFVSRFTGQTIIRYYTNEEDAVAFINFVTLCDANQQFEFI